jgi:tetratricopeptide (TPR) repeat protein
VVPDDPEAWNIVAAAYVQRGDLAGYAAAREREEKSLLAALRRDLLEADRLRSDGRLADARALYLSVAERARPEARYLSLLERALERCPPGPVDRRTAERLAPHLSRALDRCFVAGCEISPGALKRLSRFVRDPAPPQAALAALFADDLSQAGVYERRTEGFGGEEWSPYLIAKARRLAARGRIEEAREALARVHVSWQARPLYWQARTEVAQAADDVRAAAEAKERLSAAARTAWPAIDWTWHRGVARLEMVAGAPVPGFAVGIDSVPESGALVELRLDGAALGTFLVRPSVGGAPALRVASPLGRGLHVLELESLSGGQVLPGIVSLR